MKRHFIFYCPIILLVVSCGGNSLNKELREFIGSEITIPEDMVLLNANQDLNEFINREQKLIFYIDSLNCTDCVIVKSVEMWKELTGTFSSYSNVGLFIIFDTQDIPYIQRLFNTYDTGIPFFIDFNGSFKNSNQLPENTALHTFLVENGTVVLAGDPVVRTEMKQLYIDHIKISYSVD